jgi:hypothetical protein
MIPNAISAFVGCFAALLVMGEIQAGSKLIKYLAAFACGLAVTVLLSWLCAWVVSLFGHVAR